MFSNNLYELIKTYENEDNLLNNKLQQLMQPSSENCIVHESRSNELGNKLLCTPEKFVEQRNANLLKEIDMSRARIRSLSLYSPVETVLQKAISAYLYSTIR